MTNTHFVSAAEFFAVLSIARADAAQRRDQRADDVAYHKERGHAPAYCIHGTYQWTEYDNICGGCEDGVTIERMAVTYAMNCLGSSRARVKHMADAFTFEPPGFDPAAIVRWAYEPMTRHLLTA